MAGSATEYVRIRAVMLDIWRCAFETDTVDCDSDFFAMGGDSLMALEMCQELEDRLTREVDLENFFLHSSINSLADHLSRS